MQISTNRRMIKRFVRYHNVKVLVLPTRDQPAMFMPVPGWWSGGTPCGLLLVKLSSVFVYYSGQLIGGSEAKKSHVADHDPGVSPLFACLVYCTALEGDIGSRTSELGIVADGLGFWY